MKVMERRLAKLERQAGPDPSAPYRELTDDELEIVILDLSRRIIANPRDHGPEEVEKFRRTAEAIEARIVAVAKKQASPEYAKHLDGLRSSWSRRRPGIEYVCDLLDSQWGYDGWDKPDIMARRQALRERPDIATLIAAATATP